MELKKNIIYGLERISDVYKSLLWEKAKVHGISPIQIQLLLFIQNHQRELCNITHMSREFNITKATVSDAVKVLHSKELVEKDFSSGDSRSYLLFLTSKGRTLIKKLGDYAIPIENSLSGSSEEELESLYKTITDLIFKLNRSGVIKVQRTCFACRFYSHNSKGHYCNFLNKSLSVPELRLDCSEFDEKPWSSHS